MQAVKDREAVGSSQFAVHSGQSAANGNLLSTARCPLSTGFTLVEVLVALALTGTIVTIVYGSFTATSRSVDLYSSRMACGDRACLVLRLMARQFRCAYVPSWGTNPVAASLQNSTLSAPPAVSRIEPIEATGEILSFITTAGMGTGTDPSMSLCRVLYRCDPSSGTLSISCEPYMYGADHLQDSRTWQPILTGVKSLEVQFYDGRWWQARWTGGVDQTLPQSVRIALTVVDEKDRVHEFKTMVPLGCRRAPPKQPLAVPAGKL
jgi:type II secretion system protein J